jgi:hypothetical protein
VDDALSCGAPGESPAGTAARRGPGLAVRAGVIGAIGALTAATIWGEFSSHTTTSLLVLDVTVGVVACALLPVLLRWPVPGALALAVLAGPASSWTSECPTRRRRRARPGAPRTGWSRKG